MPSLSTGTTALAQDIRQDKVLKVLASRVPRTSAAVCISHTPGAGTPGAAQSLSWEVCSGHAPPFLWLLFLQVVPPGESPPATGSHGVVKLGWVAVPSPLLSDSCSTW